MTTFFAFPEMFRNHIKDSKLKTPESFDEYDPNEFPHFHVFMLTHLSSLIDVFALENNANIIAGIPEDKIKEVTYQDLLEKGLQMATNVYVV